MKQLILDHYRRWSGVLVLAAALEFGLGWSIATGPKFAFEFWAFLVALWAGATLLNFDFRTGALRAIAVLPLTGRQIGRSWWLATVAIPAIALAALLFSGAATGCHFHPKHAFPAERLALASLFTLVWLGIQFAMIFNAARGFGGNWREFIGNSLISWLTILVFFGSMLLCMDASRSLFRSAILLGFGALLTAVGWVRAEQFDPGRAGLYLGRVETPNLRRRSLGLTPLEPRIPPGQYRVPGGHGGIPFLIRTTFVRAFLTIAAMTALMVLLGRWQGQILQSQDITSLLVVVGSFMCCWFIIFYQFMPLLRQLRFFRTLPISATGLAAVMIAVAILPLIALGALVAGFAGLALGTPAALMALSSYTFILAPTSLCVFFVVWRDAGKQAYALLLFTLFCFLMGGVWLRTFFHYPEIPLSLGGPVAAISILLAFLLTRRALLRSSHAYRVQANPLGDVPWGTGR
jgi:hypothetical protein